MTTGMYEQNSPEEIKLRQLEIWKKKTPNVSINNL